MDNDFDDSMELDAYNVEEDEIIDSVIEFRNKKSEIMERADRGEEVDYNDDMTYTA